MEEPMKWIVVIIALTMAAAGGQALGQTGGKKVRIGVSETHVGYLPLLVAFHKG